MRKTGVHFEAGKIGRDFVAQFLHESEYEVVFADVSDYLVGALQSQSSYKVIEAGDGAVTKVVDDYSDINSKCHAAEVIAKIAERRCGHDRGGRPHPPVPGPVIAKGLAARTRPEPLIVIAGTFSEP